MVNLETSFAGVPLKNPLIAASSGLTNSVKKIKELEDAGIGAIVLKSLFEEQIENHSEKLTQISDYPEAADYINTYIEMNHVEKYLELIRSAKAACSIPIVASINCYKLARWTDFAKSIQDAGADALELNVFVLDPGEFGDTYLEDSYVNIVRELKKTLRIPVVIKMSKTISNLPGLIGKLKAGCRWGCPFNRFYQLDIDIAKMEITPVPCSVILPILVIPCVGRQSYRVGCQILIWHVPLVSTLGRCESREYLLAPAGFNFVACCTSMDLKPCKICSLA